MLRSSNTPTPRSVNLSAGRPHCDIQPSDQAAHHQLVEVAFPRKPTCLRCWTHDSMLHILFRHCIPHCQIDDKNLFVNTSRLAGHWVDGGDRQVLRVELYLHDASMA